MDRLSLRQIEVGDLDIKSDVLQEDTSEQIHVSSLALLKMLKHGRAGVPMEVMGLLIGDFVDNYTIRVVDVFAMPQSGTGVSVEAIDPVFQSKMLEMLQLVGRSESVVGWYHSHPGFGCWLSGVDMNTQSSFESLDERAVALVVDPIQSVKGKVVMDAFRLINPHTIMRGYLPRQTTSNSGLLNKPSMQALIHGLNRHYYSISIRCNIRQFEEKVLMSTNKKDWIQGLVLTDYYHLAKSNDQDILELKEWTSRYKKGVIEGLGPIRGEQNIQNIGSVNAKKRVESILKKIMTNNINQTVGQLLNSIVFETVKKEI